MRVGGVPEHFNLPWQQVLAARADEWVEFSGGSGAMARALARGELDAAVMLTESAVRAISRGLDAKIVGTHVHSPLRWGIHAAAGGGMTVTSGARFAISRYGSGSHLIPCVLADEEGWDVAELTFVEVGTVEGGNEALVNNRADLFFWEQFMTQPLVDRGSLERVDVFLPPWPSFVVVASDRAGDLLALIGDVEHACEERREQVDQTVAELHDRFHIAEPHAREWLSLTDWRCTPSVSVEAIERTADALGQAFGEPMLPVADLVDVATCLLSD